MVGAAIGGGDVVLTGGSTPKAAYAEFAEAVRIVGLDLADTTFWMGDERCVAPDDPRANYRMIKESLLEPLADLTVPCLKRIKGELGPDAGRGGVRARAGGRRAARVRPAAARTRVRRPHRLDVPRQAGSHRARTSSSPACRRPAWSRSSRGSRSRSR